MALPRAPVSPSDATEAARILRAKSPCTPEDFRRLDAEAKKRAVTVTDETSVEAIRSMRDALAKAKADGIPYREFVKTVGPTLGAQWGIDSPQLKTIFVNNIQQAANQAIVARLNRQRGQYPYWTLDVVEDEVTSSWCSYFTTHPVVLPAGHAWFAKNAPMRHHRCRTMLRGLTRAEAQKMGITKTPPDWPPQEGWGGSAPLGAYKANMSDKKIKADLGQGDVHVDGPVKVRKMGPIGSEKRKALPAEAFALPGARKYPIHDAAHARNAMARLEQNKGSISPAEYAIAKRNILRAYKKFGIKHEGKPVKGRFMGRPVKGLAFRFTPRATHVEVRHMSDRIVRCGSVEIDPTLLDEVMPEGEPRKRIWNQLAKIGSFRGHAAGPFELTPVIFDEIVRNFRATQNQKIPIDFEHASEQDPTQGSIPHQGAPAQGWIVDLDNRGTAGLWGLVEWLEPARTYVREGKYKFFSPAIRFGTKDRVTGQPIGARMTSGALTNNPFLDGMMPLAASDRGEGPAADNMEINANMGDYAHSMAEVMPKLRACLFESGSHLASMATLAECYDAVCRLEAMADEFREMNPDADMMTAVHHGAPLGAALTRLRDAMQMGLGMTVPEMLVIVKQMIQQAIGVHEEEMHTDEIPPSSRDMGEREMSDKDKNEYAIKMRDLEQAKTTLETKVAGLELQLSERAAKVSALEAEVVTLREAAKAREEADVTAKVELAFATYKDSHKLTDSHKRAMRIVLLNDPKLFDETYPPIAPDKRHLMRAIVPPGGARPTPEQGATEARAIVGGGLSPQDMIALADKIQKERGCSREEALSLAHKQAAPTSLRRSSFGPFGMPGVG